MLNQKKVLSLMQKVEALEKSALTAEREKKFLLKNIHPDHRASAHNLLHYLGVRAKDLRTLQTDLSALAISSIGHSESDMLGSLRKIKYLLSALSGRPAKNADDVFLEGEQNTTPLRLNSDALFGKVSFQGQSKIMVTLPTECGDDYRMVNSMVEKGMDIARINTAHDNPVVWKNMIRNIRKAVKATGKKVKIYMDLEGPKIRTGKIKPSFQEPGKDSAKNAFILLFKGSRLTLTRSKVTGQGGPRPVISSTSREIFGRVKRNEKVWFDDGKLGGVIGSEDDKKIVVDITTAPEEGFKLKAEKGINFPESDLNIPALTKKDVEHLIFIAKEADMVGYSFVQNTEDVILLQKHLKRLKREDLGIILKIETHRAFENLPALLFAVMQSRHCGVMIARGDLAVAVGYVRVAELQEEILWLAEAAQLPVVWATQVLETQIKKGIATRAEISDVVKSVRAECVMLNKGPHILEAIKTVKEINKRMAAHEDKKRKMLRSLHVAKTFVELH